MSAQPGIRDVVVRGTLVLVLVWLLACASTERALIDRQIEPGSVDDPVTYRSDVETCRKLVGERQQQVPSAVSVSPDWLISAYRSCMANRGYQLQACSWRPGPGADCHETGVLNE